MKTRHVGRLLLPIDTLTDFFHYDGGRVWYVGMPEEYHRKVSIMIEHPDMPEVPDYGEVPIVNPTYRRELTFRVDPPMNFWLKVRYTFRIIKGLWTSKFEKLEKFNSSEWG